ncbi:MerR family DNA-binding transcriptional regulator [Pseudonocardia sp. MH-G8]|uniref:MerR family DNA-binding transcriptional regulator n=1 Tax=Pseudonocardia sp. MH-G8 TaxID=1854588 RepID=UPI000BA03940|nr:MerR family DNA-binding transcriptional regulator [Pseudonocardia sp. MH-G8]OZM81154.1 MerR family DNA-binding transcriptional regulator [Pseudonocardia sp. MH-G8]
MSSLDTPDRLIGVTEAARLCAVDTSTIRRYADRGVLHAERLPSGVRRYRLSDVLALLQPQRAGQP